VPGRETPPVDAVWRVRASTATTAADASVVGVDQRETFESALRLGEKAR
jgi:hypothetical protein